MATCISNEPLETRKTDTSSQFTPFTRFNVLEKPTLWFVPRSIEETYELIKKNSTSSQLVQNNNRTARKFFNALQNVMLNSRTEPHAHKGSIRLFKLDKSDFSTDSNWQLPLLCIDPIDIARAYADKTSRENIFGAANQDKILQRLSTFFSGLNDLELPQFKLWGYFITVIRKGNDSFELFKHVILIEQGLFSKPKDFSEFESSYRFLDNLLTDFDKDEATLLKKQLKLVLGLRKIEHCISQSIKEFEESIAQFCKENHLNQNNKFSVEGNKAYLDEDQMKEIIGLIIGFSEKYPLKSVTYEHIMYFCNEEHDAHELEWLEALAQKAREMEKIEKQKEELSKLLRDDYIPLRDQINNLETIVNGLTTGPDAVNERITKVEERLPEGDLATQQAVKMIEYTLGILVLFLVVVILFLGVNL
ncbi:MAG: hypothetical protein HC914_05455 [Chloroflexaceae bacterium]|nr:hypothetical protein [Chloroflexaceae bacterium]